jgi:hypothetical protein
MADAEPPLKQRLRAAGADQRELHRGGYDLPDTEAAGERSVNLTKQALRVCLMRFRLPSAAFSLSNREPSENRRTIRKIGAYGLLRYGSVQRFRYTPLGSASAFCSPSSSYLVGEFCELRLQRVAIILTHANHSFVNACRASPSKRFCVADCEAGQLHCKPLYTALSEVQSRIMHRLPLRAARMASKRA